MGRIRKCATTEKRIFSQLHYRGSRLNREIEKVANAGGLVCEKVQSFIRSKKHK